jgi:hypothetical protein
MNISNLTEAKENLLAALSDIAEYPRELGFICEVKCSFFNAYEDESDSPEGAECIFGEINAYAENSDDKIIFSAAACVLEGDDGAPYVSAEDLGASVADARREVKEYFDKIKASAEAAEISYTEAYKKAIEEQTEKNAAPKPQSNKAFYITASIVAAAIFVALVLINALIK